MTDFKAVAGNGLKGMLDTNVVAGGNLKFISEYCNISDDLRNKADDLSSEGKHHFSLQEITSFLE